MTSSTVYKYKNTLKTDIKLHYIYCYNSYLTYNAVHVYCKYQLVNV
jgi:hypothetical protein